MTFAILLLLGFEAKNDIKPLVTPSKRKAISDENRIKATPSNINVVKHITDPSPVLQVRSTPKVFENPLQFISCLNFQTQTDHIKDKVVASKYHVAHLVMSDVDLVRTLKSVFSQIATNDTRLAGMADLFCLMHHFPSKSNHALKVCNYEV